MQKLQDNWFKILIALILILGAYSMMSHFRTGEFINSPMAIWHGADVTAAPEVTDSNGNTITFDAPAPEAGDEVTGDVVEFGTLGVRRFAVNESNPSAYEFDGTLWGLWRVNVLDPGNGKNLGYYLCQVVDGQPSKCLDQRYPTTAAQIAAIGRPSVALAPAAPAQPATRAPARTKAPAAEAEAPATTETEPTPAPAAEADEDGVVEIVEIAWPEGVNVDGSEDDKSTFAADNDISELEAGDYRIVNCDDAEGADAETCGDATGLQLIATGS